MTVTVILGVLRIILIGAETVLTEQSATHLLSSNFQL